MKWYMNHKKCSECGEEHEREYNEQRYQNRNFYCSNACRQRAYRKRKRKEEMDKIWRGAENRNG